ncbi:hox domain containing protein [Stylonychia lemnae]|uniref:Hox domain containing protein n=1 Tax=Stylonychia lemnae TaxID=5949 RepID=A0A077ZQS8_STYLE|nr:hox domain containing protein [Stylonychia lemnae]|eukprot:CDW71740.1 hox domain containing protein [Stylonychia lemnae]
MNFPYNQQQQPMVMPYLVFFMPLNQQFQNMNIGQVPQQAPPGFIPRSYSGMLPQPAGVMMMPPMYNYGQTPNPMGQYPPNIPAQQCQSQTNLQNVIQTIQPGFMPQRCETDIKNLGVSQTNNLSPIEKKSNDNFKYSNTATDLTKQITGLTDGNKSQTRVSLIIPPKKEENIVPPEIEENLFDDNSQSLQDDSGESDSDWDANIENRKKQEMKSSVVSSTSKQGFSVKIPLITSSTKLDNGKKPIKNNDWSSEENRYMKTDDQVRILESEFSKDPCWTKQKMKRLSTLLNLKESQIYKWNWDRRQMQDRYIQKRIENKDLPENLFKITKVAKNEQSDDYATDEAGESQNGYFKILRAGNFKKF